MDRTKTINLCLSISMLLLLAMAVLPLLQIQWPFAAYVYGVGAIGTLVCQLMDRYTGDNYALKRLYKLNVVSALCYVVSAALMIYSRYVVGADFKTDWLAFLTAGAVLQVYTSFRIGHELKKDAKK